MSVIRMSDLVSVMIASEGPRQLDARDHRRLHEALIRLADAVEPEAGLPSFQVVPDSEVGLRVQGVTRALWDLCTDGLLAVFEWPKGAQFVVRPERLPFVRQNVMLFQPEVQREIFLASKQWAHAVSTDLKKARIAASSSSPIRTLADGIPRQCATDSARHRAVNSIFPA
jgi:hypothetical protein